MTRRIQVLLSLFIAFAAIGAVAIYLWDDAQKGTIAEGITIGGIDVGGLDAAGAESQVRSSIVRPLEQPVKVSYEGARYELSAEKLKIRADVEGMVDQALEASEKGGIAGRTWRRISGAEVEESIEPKISYSQSAIEEFVETIAADLNRDAVNASIEPTATSLDPIASQDGLDLAESKLVDAVEGALQEPDPDAHKLKPEVDRVEPEVGTDQLAEQYADYIVVDRSSFTLRHYENLELATEYTVAIGAAGFATPTGLYNIENMAVDPTWNVPDSDWAGDLAGQVIPPGPKNPLKARWMGIYNGAGIHGTDDTGSLGSAASHGCVRMAVSDVIELYDRVSVGTPIYIS